MSSSPSIIENRSVKDLMHGTSVDAQSPPVGVLWKLGERGGVPAQVSSLSLDHNSKLQGPSPIDSSRAAL
ncbi:hypothetical protein TNCV_3627091 [Trichonephila clavipes]|nr:hypothetical protein TNCV_3627091 [Trichonephila clavipes]